MQSLAERALDAAARSGVTYADVRAEESIERHLSTKNGKPSNVATSDSVGVGIRVIVDGCWGFAATDGYLTQVWRRP
ncbi:MAG: DNA gyrase modulator [Bryobacteraceae bacterium]